MNQCKILFLTCVGIVFSIHSFSQKVTVQVFTADYKNRPGSDTIYYNFNQPLTWNDFQGKVPGSVPWGAMTASGFSFNSSMKEEDNNLEISVGIYTFFTRHDSWKKPEVNSAYHLEHEQHHFDITRLGAVKLEDEIRKAHFTVNNYRTLLNSIFDRVYREEMVWQKEYDEQTQNSKDTAQQQQWNKKISDEIKKLKSRGSIEALSAK